MCKNYKLRGILVGRKDCELPKDLPIIQLEYEAGDVIILKYDSSGNKTWSKQKGQSRKDIATALGASRTGFADTTNAWRIA